MSFIFESIKHGIIKIDKLTQQQCYENSAEILNLINLIPHIEWNIVDLLSNEMDYYGDKWKYSYVIKNSNDRIIGILISYFRLADTKHIFDSLYIHRFAIDPEYQNAGIGTKALNYFIKRSFNEIPWLLNISAQTNNNESNRKVIQFYRNIGFEDMYDVLYPEKTDILLLFERKFFKPFQFPEFELDKINLRHPRFNVITDAFDPQNVLPVFYFASTNIQKKRIVQFIFHNYNIEVTFVKPPIELTEPQIERPELEEERKLVSLPLKTVSRFISTVPYTIEDTMLFIEFFNRNGSEMELPGLDTKRWLRQLGLDGLLEIMGNTNKRMAKFVSQTGAYIKANDYYFGRGEVFGRIAYKKSQVITPKYGTYPYFFHLLFIPDGADKTLAEMDMFEYAKYDYMRKSIVQLIGELSNGDPFQRQLTLFDYNEEEYR